MILKLMSNIEKTIIVTLLLLVGAAWGGFPKVPPTVGRPWPLPQEELPGRGSMVIASGDFSFRAADHDCEMLQKAFRRYDKILFPSKFDKKSASKEEICRDRELMCSADHFTGLDVHVMQECENLPHPHMDEQYELKICAGNSPQKATLVSQSIWGALRGLETFSQLVISTSSNLHYINCTQIYDFPRFSYRGMMLDTSRHFLPLKTIRQNLDLMAMNKYNVFHWHMVDDQSFPFDSERYPDLSKKGSWSDIHVYTKKDVSSIISYARDLGIRVIPEFDTPGHVRSWGGQPGLLTPCYGFDNNGEYVPDGTFGPIDPSKEDNYKFLDNLFREISKRFPESYLHLGGDEVPFGCWQSNPEIIDFMNSLGIGKNFVKLEEYYITRLIDIIQNLPTKNRYMVWQEVFDNGVNIAPDTIIHIWKNGNSPTLLYQELSEVTKAGYQAVLSACWYLNYISYGVDWYKYYECDPHGFDGTAEQKELVIGGEACMWGEWADKTNIISRMWPRAAPVAERLWSNKEATTRPEAAAPRLEEHRCRLLRRGYLVSPLAGPSYCEGIL